MAQRLMRIGMQLVGVKRRIRTVSSRVTCPGCSGGEQEQEKQQEGEEARSYSWCG
jgi:hypothetical protein